MSRPVSAILHDVVNVATLVTLTPAAAFGHRMELERLRDEVQAAIARPAEDERVIDDISAMLMTAAIRIAGRDWKNPRWLVLVKFLLPYVREDWRRALELEMGIAS